VNTAWPPRDVVKKLVEAAEHLLRDHDCDCDCWEQDAAALDAAKEWLARPMSRIVGWRWNASPGRCPWPGQFYADLECGCRVPVTPEQKDEGVTVLQCQGSDGHRPRLDH